MVDLAIVHVSDDAVSRCQDRPTESEIPLWRFGGEKGPPVPAVRSPVPIVHTDEVDGMPPTQQVSPMTRDPPRRIVLRDPRGP